MNGGPVLIIIRKIQNVMFYLIILLGGKVTGIVQELTNPHFPAVFPNLFCNVHTKKQIRIYGGRDAKLGEFPMMVELRDHIHNRHHCGGFLIHDRYVLTAAHCLVCEDSEPCFDKLEIMVGDTTRNRFLWLPWSQPPPTRQIIPIRRVSVHEHFSPAYTSNDIALIELEKPVKKSKYVDPTVIAKTDPKLYVYCQVVGWGRTEFSNGASSKKLMTAVVQIQNSSLCKMTLAGFIGGQMICAGDLQGRNDSCFGDSGGPLICDKVVVGIVSYGYNCAMPNYAAAYTDVSYYQGWVRAKLKKLIANATIESKRLKLFSSMLYYLIGMIILYF